LKKLGVSRFELQDKGFLTLEKTRSCNRKKHGWLDFSSEHHSLKHIIVFEEKNTSTHGDVYYQLIWNPIWFLDGTPYRTGITLPIPTHLAQLLAHLTSRKGPLRWVATSKEIFLHLNGGLYISMVYSGKNLLKWMIWGYHHFRNLHFKLLKNHSTYSNYWENVLQKTVPCSKTGNSSR